MARYALMAVVLLAAATMVWSEDNVTRGELNGTVVGVEAVKTDTAIRLALTITTEAGDDETFMVGPDSREAYALVGGLKAGEKVRLSWVSENGGETKWIRSIRRVQREGEGKDRPRDGETRKDGPRDGETRKEGTRERDRE